MKNEIYKALAILQRFDLPDTGEKAALVLVARDPDSKLADLEGDADDFKKFELLKPEDAKFAVDGLLFTVYQWYAKHGYDPDEWGSEWTARDGD